MKPILTTKNLIKAAKDFCKKEEELDYPNLYGKTDGKAVGTLIEHKFQTFLDENYRYERGSSARRIDLPGDEVNTDIKVTSVKQPQSSCPFRNAQQKIFGLGYNLLVFVYEKKDNVEKQTAELNFVDCSFIDKERTGDYTVTFRINEMIKDGANEEDIAGYLNDKNIPLEYESLRLLAQHILKHPPKQGYLTISNALQWRLQYARVVNLDVKVQGIHKIIQ